MPRPFAQVVSRGDAHWWGLFGVVVLLGVLACKPDRKNDCSVIKHAGYNLTNRILALPRPSEMKEEKAPGQLREHAKLYAELRKKLEQVKLEDPELQRMVSEYSAALGELEAAVLRHAAFIEQGKSEGFAASSQGVLDANGRVKAGALAIEDTCSKIIAEAQGRR